MKMNKEGFTLVELMVVLAILGLLAGIGIPSYMNVLNRAKVGTDIASIAQVQANVNAFIAEIGGWAKITGYSDDATVVLAAAPASGASAVVSTAAAGTSMITGGTITLASFFDTTALPLLKSTEGDAKGWYISYQGKVYVGTATTPSLPAGVVAVAP